MHELGILLTWLAIQSTCVLGFACVIHFLSRKYNARVRSLSLGLALGMLVVLPILSLSPWPNLLELFAGEVDLAATGVEERAMEHRSEGVSQSVMVGDDAGRDLSESTDPGERTVEQEFVAAAAWRAFVARLNAPAPIVEPDEITPSWQTYVALTFLIGFGLATFRLVAAGLLLTLDLKRSQPVSDGELLALLERVRLDAGCTVPVALRVSPLTGTAATWGWRSTVILLPNNWNEWTTSQLRAVLAHEVAHIRGRDSLASLAAEAVRALYFYQPLIHWVIRRLRLEQEFAADAFAATYVGGTPAYLRILANMALTQSRTHITWPAQAFLPTRTAFLRRIDMLKNSPPAGESRWLRGAIICAMVICLFVTGSIRRPGVVAQEPTVAVANTESVEPLSLELIPSEALVLIGVRPAQLLAMEAMQSIRRILDEEKESTAILGIEAAEVDSVVIGLVPDGEQGPPRAVVVLRTTGKIDQATVLESFGGRLSPVRIGKHLSFQPVTSGQYESICFYDNTTLVMGANPDILKRALSSDVDDRKGDLQAAWKDVAKQGFCGIFDAKAFRSAYEDELGRQLSQMPMWSLVAPLWNRADQIAWSVDFADGMEMTAQVSTDSEESSESVKNTLAALLTLGKNVLDQQKQQIPEVVPERQRTTILSMMELGSDILNRTDISSKGKSVEIRTAGDPKRLVSVTAAMVPAMLAARTAAKRAQSMNNLKQIALAMHNYHDAYGHFPAAAVVGPDGRTMHSWRVAILPFLDQAELYDEYNRDEPWDSENNKKVLAKIPAVYRHPADDSAPTNSSYYVLTGESTAFSNPKGTKLREIIDGAATSILVVSSKRDIPWTKPEDIPYSKDTNAGLPQFGGFQEEGFSLALCDGSVRFLSKAIDTMLLRSLIEINDMKPVGEF